MTDYIEREAIENIICDICERKLEYCPSRDFTGCEPKELLKAIPIADVKPIVRGEWRLYSPFTDTYECNNCGYQVIDESFRTNFCPNCGAKMEVEDG